MRNKLKVSRVFFALHDLKRLKLCLSNIGRGFNVWGDFMNLTAVIMALIELQTDPLVPIETKKAIAQSGSLPGTGNFSTDFKVLC